MDNSFGKKKGIGDVFMYTDSESCVPHPNKERFTVSAQEYNEILKMRDAKEAPLSISLAKHGMLFKSFQT